MMIDVSVGCSVNLQRILATIAVIKEKMLVFFLYLSAGYKGFLYILNSFLNNKYLKHNFKLYFFLTFKIAILPFMC